ncbi:MAG: hypothetical protein RI883_1395, partial [Bacteroidota bacterium]
MHKLTHIHFLILLFCFGSCANNADTLLDNKENIFLKKIIEVDELLRFQDDNTLKIIDLRSIDEYQKGHFKNAIRLSRIDFEDTTSSIEGMMATKDQMENLLGVIGIKNTDYIVIYDGKGNPDACRLYWVLDHYGHKNKALLNGGFSAMKSDEKILISKKTILNPSVYKFNSQKCIRYASLEDVRNAQNDPNYIIIDTRSKSEFSGKELKGEVERTGHIPSSINIYYERNIDIKNKCKFKSAKQLRKLYSNSPKNKKIIVYCHSGVRSALTTFVLCEILGYKNVQNYDGSW